MGSGTTGGVSQPLQVTDQPDGCVWYPVVEAEDKEVAQEMEEPVPTAEQGTQTQGFFQSARSMTILQAAAKQQQQQLGTGQHPAPAHVAAYSPGRGFWRQQVDHVAHHLRTHTANCEEFQQTFGQLQMGKVCVCVRVRACVCVCVRVCVHSGDGCVSVLQVELGCCLSDE